MFRVQSDEEYTARIELNKLLIKVQFENDNNEIHVSGDLVSSKSGKAANIHGLQTEHLKFGGEVLMDFVTKLASRIINTCEISTLFNPIQTRSHHSSS